MPVPQRFVFDRRSGTGENINTIFDDIKHDLTRLDSWNRINDAIRVINDSIETIDQSERKGAISITRRIGDVSIPLPIWNESEGVRRFFAHLLAFHQKPPKQIMVFEEPEKGIYPAAFAALAGEMKNCYSCGQGGDYSIFYLLIILKYCFSALLTSSEASSIDFFNFSSDISICFLKVSGYNPIAFIY